MSKFRLRAVEYGFSRGIALLVECGGQVGNDFSSLHPLEPLNGAVVAFLSYLAPHLLRHGCAHVIERDVAGIHHNEPVSLFPLGLEHRPGVVLGAQVPRNLLLGFRFCVRPVLRADLRYDLQRGIADYDPIVLLCYEHISSFLLGYEERPPLDVVHCHPLAEAMPCNKLLDGLFRYDLKRAVQVNHEIAHAGESGEFYCLSDGVSVFPGEYEPSDELYHATICFLMSAVHRTSV